MGLFDPFWKKEVNFSQKASVLKKLDGITDQNLLARIAEEAPSTVVRLRAVEKLEKQEALSRIIRKEKNEDIRLKAIRKSKDVGLLKEVALGNQTDKTSRSAWNALMAIGALDQSLINQTAQDCSKSSGVRSAAAEMVTDQAILAKLALDPNPVICHSAINRLTDVDVLNRIVETEENVNERNMAIERLIRLKAPLCDRAKAILQKQQEHQFTYKDVRDAFADDGNINEP